MNRRCQDNSNVVLLYSTTTTMMMYDDFRPCSPRLQYMPSRWGKPNTGPFPI